MGDKEITIIKPTSGWSLIRVKELWGYRELLYFLTWRDIKVRYKQTLIGVSWVILQPFLTMVVFTVFFNKIAKVPSEGIPYPIFSYSGLLLWTYFSASLSNAGNSLINNTNLINKVYFPRLIIPLYSTVSGLVDYFVALSILIIMMFYYRVLPNFSVVFLPLIVLLCFLFVTGLGLWLCALNVKYRDVRYVIPFLIQLLLFATPVIYPITIFPEKLRWILALNPLYGIIDAHRACILGFKQIDWVLLSVSTIITLLIFVSGMFYFRKTERFFADII
jgi:lipopolysaccharide transport system permease protein